MFAKLILWGWILLCLLVSGCAEREVDFIDAAGNSINWEDFRGQWLVINYWAEWCAPCREEIPELNALHQRKNDVRVLGVNFDNPPIEDLKRQIKAFKVEFPVIQNDPEQQLGYLMPDALPTTYLFNTEGTLAHKLVGPQTRESILKLIKGG